MPTRRQFISLSAGFTAAAALGLSGCGGGTKDAPKGGETLASDAKVTITVADKPTADQTAELKLWKTQVKAFNEKYPNITLDQKEAKYDPQTFQTQLGGGNLPDEMVVPFTEPQALIQRKQVAELTAALADLNLKDKLNPATLKIAQDAQGGIFAVPYQAYTLGVLYNRELFTKAGLDAETPPTTWDEVRTAAKAIADKTGKTGFAMHTSKNTGGWIFTAICYAFGGAIENEDGTKATIDLPQNVEALTALRQMRFEDDSMGKNFLYDYESILRDFAAGRIGMLVGDPGIWDTAVVQFKMNGSHFGSAGMPKGGSGEGKTLGGGSVAIVSPKASSEQVRAATMWVQQLYLNKYFDQNTAVTDAKAAAEAGKGVGIPAISPLSDAAREQYDSWIAEYVNVPVKNFKPYTASEPATKLIPEPAKKAQQVYAALDPVIQKALTDKDADPAKLLADANADVQRQLGR